MHSICSLIDPDPLSTGKTGMGKGLDLEVCKVSPEMAKKIMYMKVIVNLL